MKTIGLIGGMSWESTLTYYQTINEEVKEALGGLYSAKLLLYSVDFHEIEECQASGDWGKSAEILADAATRLEGAGADFIVICTNTMHKVVPEIQARIQIPILHIADATAKVLKEDQIQKVLLLGTKYTMTEVFYKERLQKAGFEVLIPGEEEIEEINRVIYEELCLGQIREESAAYFLQVIEEYTARGAGGVILGCTEIGLLIKPDNCPCAVYDTALIHAKEAAKKAITD
ncbi:aspartate racemase [Lachnospiraceae bacterium PF1-21]|uniref:aspartate/glutamate racemase family protein n=1 Tax=Ohessyouella blattaphilus TaxID=2949333 RepID=UPI00256A6073|nr:aspartate/glutamate racemase family protein [Lachnospiraceae bacterium OttesenSCG-928-J05]